MANPPPDVGPDPSVSAIVEPASSYDVFSYREMEFQAQRQLGRKCLLGIIGVCRDSNPSGGARQFGAVRQKLGNLA